MYTNRFSMFLQNPGRLKSSGDCIIEVYFRDVKSGMPGFSMLMPTINIKYYCIYK